MDTYIEYIIKKQKTAKDTLICIGIVLAAILLCLYGTPLIYIYIQSLSFLVPLIMFGIVYAAYKLIVARNIEFEYLLTGGDLDIDKIMNRTSRKRVISVRRREFEIMAPKGSGRLPSGDGVTKTIDASSGNPDAKVYGIVANLDAGRTLIYFEPTDRMIEQLQLKNRQKVFLD